MNEHHDPFENMEGRVAERRNAYDDSSDAPTNVAIYRFALAKHQGQPVDEQLAKYIEQCPQCQKILQTALRVLAKEESQERPTLSSNATIASTIAAYYSGSGASESGDSGSILDEFDPGEPDIQWLAQTDGVRLGQLEGYRSIVLVVDCGNIPNSSQLVVEVCFDDRDNDSFGLLPGITGNDVVVWPARSSTDSTAKIKVRINGKSIEHSISRSKLPRGTTVLATVVWDSDVNEMWERLAEIDDRILMEYRAWSHPADWFFDKRPVTFPPTYVQPSELARMKDRHEISSSENETNTSSRESIEVVVSPEVLSSASPTNSLTGTPAEPTKAQPARLVHAPSVSADEWEASVEFETQAWDGCRAVLTTDGLLIASTIVRGNRADWSSDYSQDTLPRSVFANIRVLIKPGKNRKEPQ